MTPGRALLLCAVLAVAGPAPAAHAEAHAETTEPPEHRIDAFFTTGAMAYLSAAQTMGGAGGGVGIRDTLRDLYVLQADVDYLMLLGNTFSLRLAAGLQRGGSWNPAAFVTVTCLFGDRLRFLTPEHPTPLTGPTVALGLMAAPLRFHLGNAHATLLAVGVGVGTDLPGVGALYQVTAVEVGAVF